MSFGQITLHIVNDIPWSNLNRDDTGTPKRTILGGVERGMLSSQSIKRGARKDFEKRVLELLPSEAVSAFDPQRPDDKISDHASIRSRYLAEWAITRAKELAEEQGIESFNEKEARKLANSVVKKLTGSEDTITWLSMEELETLAVVVLDGTLTENEMIELVIPECKRTGSLAIAAFGRMFANAQDRQTEAAIAVGPAISTHANLIETDYFIAGDDFGFFSKDKKSGDVSVSFQGAGAAHLGTALYTSGVFYRTVTIDVRELLLNWSGSTGEHARELLSQLVTSIVYGLPTGKKNTTSPYVAPPLVIAEEQSYREAYSISTPVQVDTENGGGFLRPTIEHLSDQHKRVREFSPQNYGRSVISGAFSDIIDGGGSTLEDLVTQVVDWILEQRVVEPAPIEEMVSEEASSESVDIFSFTGSGEVAE